MPVQSVLGVSVPSSVAGGCIPVRSDHPPEVSGWLLQWIAKPHSMPNRREIMPVDVSLCRLVCDSETLPYIDNCDVLFLDPGIAVATAWYGTTGQDESSNARTN